MLNFAGIFKDHMVLQRCKPISVWGIGTPGTEVSVSLHTSKSIIKVKEDGTWKVALAPLQAGTDYTLNAVCGKEKITVKDVAIGEVWLDGGQSNMELPLINSENGREICKAYNGSKIRFYQVPKCPVMNDLQKQQEKESRWNIADSENVGNMSAVAFYFASYLTEKLDCVIGIIDCYWGGTSIACWMSIPQLKKLTSGKNMLEEYIELVGEKSAEQYAAEMREYDTEYRQWQKKVDDLKLGNPDISWKEIHEECGECPWPQPVGWQSPFRPGGLYETMIQRIAGFSIKGFIYYQGEEDVQRFECYCDMMQMLVTQWRMDWNDWQLPFLFVQLPMYIAEGETDDRRWAMQREQQRMAADMIQNSGMISLADCGEFDNIHPLNKKTPGERLAVLAESMVYGNNGAVTPTADYVYSDEKKLYISFCNVPDKLTLHQTSQNPFEIAGADGKFVPAQVNVIENDLICAESESIEYPCALRYAWYNFGEASLFTESGIAASPFLKQI